MAIQDQFPEFNLGDKVNFQAEGNDRGWKVYERMRESRAS